MLLKVSYDTGSKILQALTSKPCETLHANMKISCQILRTGGREGEEQDRIKKESL